MDLDKILRTYPKPAQFKGLKFVMERGSVGIRHGTGMGKTYLAIMLAALYQKKGLVDTAYFFHIKSAVSAFEEDFEEHTRVKPLWIWEAKDWKPNHRFNMVQSNRINKVAHLILGDPRRKIVLFDEIQVIKTPTSGLRKSFDALRSNFKYVIGLTATPLANKIDDIYWTTQYIRPGHFGMFWDFKRKYCVLKRKKRRLPTGRMHVYHEVTGYKNLEHLADKVAEVWQSENIEMPINFHEEQLNGLSVSEEDLYLTRAQGICDGEYKDFVVRLPYLQKVVDMSETKLASVSTMVKKLRQEHGVIVYFPLKEAMRPFAERVGGDISFFTGSTSSDERKRVRSEFGPGKVILMTIAGSRSLNLHQGNQVVFYSIPFEIEAFQQTIGRMARPLVTTYDHIDVWMPYVPDTIDYYRMSMMRVNNDLVLSLLKGGDPNSPKEYSEVRRDTLIQMRKNLLWREENR